MQKISIVRKDQVQNVSILVSRFVYVLSKKVCVYKTSKTIVHAVFIAAACGVIIP